MKVRSKLSERIAEQISGLISGGEIAPNQHLSTQKLAARFNVSRTPVREALELLEARKTVVKQLNRGYFARDKKAVPSTKDQQDHPPYDAPAIYYKLAEDWLHDRVPSNVTEQYLLDRYQLTKGELSTVLSQALSEGWAERKAGYGWRLLPVAKGPEALEQIYRYRAIIEPAALLEPTFLLDQPIASQLADVLQGLLDGNIDRLPLERLHIIGVDFHEALVRMSGNPFLLQSLERANRYRRLLEYRSMDDRRRYYEETREHLEILKHVQAGDTVGASYLMRQHLQFAIGRKRPGSR